MSKKKETADDELTREPEAPAEPGAPSEAATEQPTRTRFTVGVHAEPKE